MYLKVILLLISTVFGFPISLNGLHGLLGGQDKQINLNSNGYQMSEIKEERIPSEIEGASIARTLVSRESLMNVNTIKEVTKSDGKHYVPVSSVEYYADCDNDGDFYWLVVDIGSTYQNIKHGSEHSYTIRVGDHHVDDGVKLEYPGGIVNSPAGSPRLNIHGTLRDVEDKGDKFKELEECFLKRHPDSKYWIPGKSLSHRSHWTKLEVDELYMIGGFGDRAYIGSIDTGIYHSVTSLDDH